MIGHETAYLARLEEREGPAVLKASPAARVSIFEVSSGGSEGCATGPKSTGTGDDCGAI